MREIYAPGKLFVFFHVAIMNDWMQLLEEQYKILITSGLFHKIDKLFIGLVGHGAGELASSISFDKKVEVIYHSEELAEAEIPTLRALHKFCLSRKENCNILYIHNKGVSYDPLTLRRIFVDDWRKLMQYFLIEKHQECLEYLKYFDICGTNWIFNNEHPHFVGNYWWANSDYIKRLEDIIKAPMFITVLQKMERFKAESWIGTGPAVKAKNLYISPVNHYLKPCPRHIYA